MLRTADSGFDAAVVDNETRTVALVEVKAHPIERWEVSLQERLARVTEPIPFVLAIDLGTISLYRPVREILGQPVVRLDAKQILQHYDPEFPGRRVFDPYLLTLAEAWLRDLAYHWKSDEPPGSAELRGTGLLEMIAGGTTQRLGA